MPNDHLVSVIVPCFRQGKFLSAALESVLNQTYSNWECIIVNDGSPDDTDEIARRWTKRDPRFLYVNKPNGGTSSAKNAGWRVARGTYIQLLDADDLIEKDKFRQNLSWNQSEAGADRKVIFYSSMRYFEDHTPEALKILGRNEFVAHIELKHFDSMLAQRELVWVRNPCVISAPLYPRSVFDELSGFDEILNALEDWDFHIRCLEKGYKFHHHCTRESYALIRLHNDSAMRRSKLLSDSYDQLNRKHSLRPIYNMPEPSSMKKLVRELAPPILLRQIRRLRGR
jgi:glycosyltransferase involved in cell wall biosynthesis